MSGADKRIETLIKYQNQVARSMSGLPANLSNRKIVLAPGFAKKRKIPTQLIIRQGNIPDTTVISIIRQKNGVHISSFLQKDERIRRIVNDDNFWVLQDQNIN